MRSPGVRRLLNPTEGIVILRQEAGDGYVSVLANVIERTSRAPTIELFYLVIG